MAHSTGFRGLQRLFAVAQWAKARNIAADEAEAAWTAAGLDRRAVLRGMVGAAALAALPMGLSGCDDEGGSGGGDSAPGDSSLADGGVDQGQPAAVTVAIVGAGIAGLHCAYRLKNSGVAVQVFDAQDRVGGRMWTGRGLFPGDLHFEIGGELIDSNHATMFALAEELGIQLDDRFASERPGMVRETNVVNGARVTVATLLSQTMAVAEAFTAAYDAAENDDAAFEMLDNTSMAAWLAVNVPPATFPELHAVLTAAYVGEFGLEAAEQSILNLLYLFGFDAEDEFRIFGESDERWHTHLGNDTFTTALADAIGPAAITQQAKLVKAAGPAGGPFTLTFERVADGTRTDVTAAHIVFALPFSTLREVDLTELELSDNKRTTIAGMGYGTNAKVMGHFTSRPWWTVHNESGLLTTDRGVQQGWDSTIGQAGDGVVGIWTNFVGGTQGLRSGEGTAEDWFGGILADLEVIWPGCQAAWSGAAQRMHWPSFPWSKGSYTCYRPGQWQFWSTEGVREGNVHFCGEHCSVDFQGWMEGAAETGGLVADEVIGDLGLAQSKVAYPWRLRLARRQRDPRTGRVRWARRSRRLRQG